MAKHLNISLDFSANTSQVKTAIHELQSSLSQVAFGQIDPKIDTAKMKEASAAAQELSIHLSNAFNADTGKLDLSKLDRSLNVSKTNIQDLSMKLLSAGSTGEQAFVKLAQSIAAADRPMLTLNSKLREFGTTLANTARWQLSSSMLHGFIGAVQDAFHYAQDLNESLTNIKIVTGLSTDQLAKFAEQANKSAKALSATTTEYTDAALIFYQQGLSDEEVVKRTDVTIKMAQAAGESAQAVSSYMTAIWNNFDNGTKSLEYYGDVITKLGAETAASSEEIAAGLEKFASIGEIVGLSYEYATAAVTTIVDKTRASADTVGTALKTIFARLQGLKLGETLEDGVDLNKYSEALKAVGVQVLDTNGELRKADDIIADLGEKWKTLSTAQQTALAQTVAGTRQYTHLMALMKDFDSFEMNVDLAKNSEGTLTEQQELYAEGWEAARDRVKASMEGIYSDLIDDQFFIKLSNGLSGLIDSLGGFIDGIGGLKGILAGVGSFFLAGVANKITPALENLRHTFTVIFSSAADRARVLSGAMNETIQNSLDNNQFSDSSKVALQNAMAMNDAKSKLAVIEKDLTATERQNYEMALMSIEQQQKEAQVIGDRITKRKEELQLMETAFNYAGASKDISSSRNREEEALIAQKRQAQANYIADPTQENKTAFTGLSAQLNEHRAATERLTNAREAYAQSLYQSYLTEMEATQGSIEQSTQLYSIQSMIPEAVDHYVHALAGLQNSNSIQHQKETFSQLKNEIELIIGDSCPELNAAMDRAMSMKTPEAFKKQLSEVMRVLKQGTVSAADLEKVLSKMGQSANIVKIKKGYGDLNKDLEELKRKQEAVNNAVKSFNPRHMASGLESVTKAAAGFGQLAMSIQSVRSLISTWSNEDLSIGEKLTSSLMSASMFIPSLIGGFSSLKTAVTGSAIAQQALAVVMDEITITQSEMLAGMTAEEIAKKLKITTDQAELVLMRAKVANFMQEKKARGENLAAITAEQLAEKTGMSIDQAKIVLDTFLNKTKEDGTKYTLSEALAEAGLSAVRGTGTISTIAQTVANWALNASMSPLLVITLLLVAAFVSLALIVVGVVAAVKAVTEAYNKDAIAAKEAADYADKMTERYEKLADEANKFKEAVSGYEEAVNSLDKLDKKTAEYQEALEEANKKAKELIETYQLWGKFSYDENGLIKFDDGVLDQMQQDKNDAARAAESDMYAAKIAANSAKMKSEYTNTSRNIGADVKYTATGVDPDGNSYTYEALRNFTDGEMQQVIEAFSKLENATDLQGEALGEALIQTGCLSESLIDNIKAITDNKDAFVSLTGVVNGLSGENDYLERELVGNMVEEEYGDKLDAMATDEDGNIDQDVRSKLANAATDRFAEAEKAKSEGISDKISQIDVSDIKSTGDLKDVTDAAGNKIYANVNNDEDLARKYAEVVLGMSAEEVSNLDYKSGTGKGTLKDSKGTAVIDGLNDEYMRQQLAKQAEIDKIYAQYQNEDVTVNGVTEQQYMDSLNKVADVAGSEGQYGDVGMAILNSLQNGTEEIDLSSIFADLDSSETEELTALARTDPSQLIEKLGFTETDLKNLGYTDAAQFAAAFDEGLQDWTPETANAAVAAELDVSAEALEAYMEQLKDSGKAAELTDDELRELAKTQITFEKNVKKAQQALEDNADALDESKKGTIEQAEACSELATGLNAAFGEGAFDTQTVVDNLDTVKAALEGDAEAINKLQALAAQNMLEEQLGDLPTAVSNAITEIANIEGVDVGEKVKVGEDNIATDLETLYQNATAAVLAGGGTVAEAMEEANKVLNAVGFQAPDIEMEEKEVTVTGELPSGWVPQADGSMQGPDGQTLQGVKWTQNDGGTYTYTQKILVPKNPGDTMEFTKTKETITPSKSSKDSGGSKKEPEKLEKKKDTDMVERYKEIEDSLDDLRDSIEDTNKAADRMYGASRIAQMQKSNKMIQDEIKLLKQKKEQAQQYLKLDRIALDNAAAEVGVNLTYDESGNITNYTEELTRLTTEYNDKVQSINDAGGANEEQKKEMEELDKKIDELKSTMAQYEETRELIEDLDNEMDDKFYEWQDNNAEMLSYKLEIQMELNDDELRLLEAQLNRIGDNFYQRAEGIAIMSSQLGIHSSMMGTYTGHLAELSAAYAANDISQEAYVEGLDQVLDGVYGNMDALVDLDNQMLHYYSDTLEQAGQEIDKITDRLSNQTSVLEHYLSLVKMIGKETDYAKIGIVLEGQAQTTKNEMIAAREEYEMYSKEADEMYLKWQSAANEAQAELYKNQYDAAIQAADEAQQEYLDKAESYAETLTSILENSLSKYAQNLENAMTGGTSFDQLTAKLERASALQEEYLTTTNKIYETNKLMNQAQQQIDKSTNTVAKQRLQQFISETAHLQEKNKLSQFELDIQQAKYELLLAEIALEEAQNAKSQVRLQRDAEGNFGYVYTADASEVAGAEQELADAQNNLYNIILEGANDYTEKYYQIYQEMYDTLTELQEQYLSGAFESEAEYEQAVLDAKEYYYDKLAQYSELYSIAAMEDSTAVQEAWSSDFDLMSIDTESWKDAVDGYVFDVRTAFGTWEEQMSQLASDAGLGGDLGNLKDRVKDVTDESNNLVKELTKSGGVLDAIQQEIDAVSQLTDQYAMQRQAVLDMISAYEALAASIIAAKQAEAWSVNQPAETPSQESDKNSNKDGGGGDDDKGDGKPRVGDVVTYLGGTYYHDSYGSSPSGNRGAGKQVTITYLNESAPYPIHVESSNSAYGWLKKEQISGYDTGGYTGEWGPYGKLALLHEKELVLNKNETENFLTGMNMLNNIVNTIDLYSANSQLAGLLNSPTFGGINSSESLEQQVTIEANFPNVSSRTEIEEAFTTLINRASQYANRK